MTYELTGNIKVLLDMQTFDSGFTKREFVVTVPDGKYPQDIKLEFVKDKCALLDSVQEGDEVKVTFDLRGNEYNGKYYVNLTARRIESQTQEQPSAPSEQPHGEELQADQDSGVLPF